MGLYPFEVLFCGVLIDKTAQSVCLDDLPKETKYVCEGPWVLFYLAKCLGDAKMPQCSDELRARLGAVLERKVEIYSVEGLTSTLDIPPSTTFNLRGARILTEIDAPAHQ